MDAKAVPVTEGDGFQFGSGVSIELSSDEALVLFEWLSTRGDKNDLPFEHAAEQKVLWDMTGSLEALLVEPFKSDYRDLVAVSRERLAGSE